MNSGWVMWMYVCMYVRMYVCMYICMYECCMCVWLYVFECYLRANNFSFQLILKLFLWQKISMQAASEINILMLLNSSLSHPIPPISRQDANRIYSSVPPHFVENHFVDRHFGRQPFDRQCLADLSLDIESMAIWSMSPRVDHIRVGEIFSG